MKQIHCVYITTNLINGKQYIGDHSTYKLDDAYMGSGKLIISAIQKYKKENFERKILETFDKKEEAFSAQEKYINEYNTLSPNGYNISPKGGHQIKNSVSAISKEKMSIAKRKPRKPLSESHKENIKNSLKDKTLSEETKNKMKKPKSQKHCENIKRSQIGKILSSTHIENIRKARIGGIGPTAGKHFDKISRKYL
jgi:hypothetical protein